MVNIIHSELVAIIKMALVRRGKPNGGNRCRNINARTIGHVFMVMNWRVVIAERQSRRNAAGPKPPKRGRFHRRTRPMPNTFGICEQLNVQFLSRAADNDARRTVKRITKDFVLEPKINS